MKLITLLISLLHFSLVNTIKVVFGRIVIFLKLRLNNQCS